MTKGRLEAFSDGVIAIIITIMVLELRVPHGEDLPSLRPLAPVFLSYVLSFVYVGIYWNNHHHLLHAVRHVDGRILWANLHLLFWLSLFPFVTHWIGRDGLRRLAGRRLRRRAAAGGLRVLAAGARAARPPRRRLGAGALRSGSDVKGNISLACYVLGILLAAFVEPLARASRSTASWR